MKDRTIEELKKITKHIPENYGCGGFVDYVKIYKPLGLNTSEWVMLTGGVKNPLNYK